jgi:hypothetical protein
LNKLGEGNVQALQVMIDNLQLLQEEPYCVMCGQQPSLHGVATSRDALDQAVRAVVEQKNRVDAAVDYFISTFDEASFERTFEKALEQRRIRTQ